MFVCAYNGVGMVGLCLWLVGSIKERGYVEIYEQCLLNSYASFHHVTW
jgi:hypothetical protein